MSFYLFVNDSVRGPYSDGELRDMLAHKEIRPETPACREGESEWSTLEICLGLRASSPVKSPSSPPAAFQAPAQFTPTDTFAEKYTPDITFNPAFAKKGIGRLTYFLLCLGIGLLAGILQCTAGEKGSLMISIFTFVVSFVPVVLRLQSIGMSSWWSLLNFVPLVNILFGGLLIAAPAGFSETRRFDTAGKVILVLYGLLILLGIGAAIMAYTAILQAISSGAIPLQDIPQN